MKRQGFTLIELLAVIVILAIVAIIAVPSVINVIEDARKGSFKNSAYGIIESAEYNHALKTIKDSNPGEIKYTYANGVESSTPDGYKLEYKGQKPKDGTIVINEEGQVSLALHDGTYCAEKGYEDSEVTLSDKTKEECTISSEITLTIVLNGSAHEIVEIHSDYIDKGAVAREPSGSVIDEIDVKITSNNVEVPSVDTSKLLQYKITYTVKYDGIVAKAIRTVTVKDTIPPVLTVPGNIELYTDGIENFDFMDGVEVSDNSLEEITVKIRGNLSILPGQYLITYIAEDSSGNKTEKNRYITVLSVGYPKITILGSNPATINVSSSYIDDGATATDSIDGDITNKIVTTGTVNINIVGAYTITYSVLNSVGKQTTVTREVNVVDNVPPVITFSPNGNTTYAKSRSAKVTVTDVHSNIDASSLKYLWNTSTTPPSEVSFTNTFTNGGTISSPSGASGGYYLWIKALDTKGNTKIQRSNIFNLDNTNPVVTNVTSNATNIESDKFTITRSGNASDAHSGLATNPYIYQTSTNGTSWITKCTNNTTTCNVTGLNSETTYYYRICVNDKASNQTCIGGKTVKSNFPFACGNDLLDVRDNNTYKTVKIGDQCWFAEDLRYDCSREGYNNIGSGNSWSSNNNCGNQGSGYNGLLYQWLVAMKGSTVEGSQGLCPEGWHIPTDDEWKTLEMYLGMTQEDADKSSTSRGTNEADKLKGLTPSWCSGTSGCGESGFNALPAGRRVDVGSLNYVGSRGFWWTSTSAGTNAWYRDLYSGYPGVYRNVNSRLIGRSVRCLWGQ